MSDTTDLDKLTSLCWKFNRRAQYWYAREGMEEDKELQARWAAYLYGDEYDPAGDGCPEVYEVGPARLTSWLMPLVLMGMIAYFSYRLGAGETTVGAIGAALVLTLAVIVALWSGAAVGRALWAWRSKNASE